MTCTKYGKRGETGNLRKQISLYYWVYKINLTLMYMPNTCRLVWNKNYMLSEISEKCLCPAETDSVGPIVLQLYIFFQKLL